MTFHQSTWRVLRLASALYLTTATLGNQQRLISCKREGCRYFVVCLFLRGLRKSKSCYKEIHTLGQKLTYEPSMAVKHLSGSQEYYFSCIEICKTSTQNNFPNVIYLVLYDQQYMATTCKNSARIGNLVRRPCSLSWKTQGMHLQHEHNTGFITVRNHSLKLEMQSV